MEVYGDGKFVNINLQCISLVKWFGVENRASPYYFVRDKLMYMYVYVVSNL